MERSIDLRAEAMRIIDTVLESHRLDGTSLCATIVNGKKSNETITKDLGDYLPFFLYFGYTSFCCEHVKDITSRLRQGLLPGASKLFKIRVTSTYDHSDYLLGLMDYLDYVKDAGIEHSLRSTLEVLWQRFFDREIPSSYISTLLGVALPFFDTKDGMYVEIFCDYYKKSGEKLFLDRAIKLSKILQKVRRNCPVSLLPALARHNNVWGRVLESIPQAKKQCRVIRTMKNNTNSLFGALSLFDVTKDPELSRVIQEWLDALIRYMVTTEGAVYNFATLEKGHVAPYDANLTAAFAVIDLLCDASRCLNYDGYLEQAEKIAKFWLSLQGKTGLFPLSPGGSASYLDSETDMIIALQKLNDLTGNNTYGLAAQRAFEGILRFHNTAHGYVISVDIEKGNVVNSMLKTKFICLLLKAFILFLEGGSVYANENIFKLLRDR